MCNSLNRHTQLPKHTSSSQKSTTYNTITQTESSKLNMVINNIRITVNVFVHFIILLLVIPLYVFVIL
jgi:gamma-glutamyl-gamma-aminobutyrate hydrolase PuuD